MKEHVEGDPDLAQILDQFIGDRDDKKDVRIIDISGLPNEVAGPLTAAIARLLFQYKLYQSLEERKRDPILLICEEAHRYVPNRGEALYAAAQTAIRRLAKEGRKYGLGLMLVSQRPSDVEETVLSQCNTWLVLRLTNSTDQNHVARMLPDTLAALTAMLPSLPRQEALFVGEGAALPARIKLRTLTDDQIPESADVPFGEGWANDPPDLEALRAIAARMAGRAEA
jgi:DNA helicase HerA-like ATPase